MLVPAAAQIVQICVARLINSTVTLTVHTADLAR